MLTTKISVARTGGNEFDNPLIHDYSPEVASDHEIEVIVLFLSEKQARRALRLAGQLARNLNAHIRLLALKEVPLAFSVDRPPVAVPFTVKRLVELASEGVQGSLDTIVHLCYCRNKNQALTEMLKPRSLVIMGGRKSRWWRTKEGSLAGLLLRRGHEVIFAAKP